MRARFQIEEAAEIAEFTCPVGITTDLPTRPDYYRELAEQVFAIKRRHFLSPQFADKYQRPQVLQNVLKEIDALHPFVTIPIFRIQAVKPA